MTANTEHQITAKETSWCYVLQETHITLQQQQQPTMKTNKQTNTQ